MDLLFKVLLVDDEPNVRKGIKMMIPWDDIGCKVIAEADDGDDGLAKIMTLQPDIVIADIKMPGKTGIEMTEAAKALGFKGKILILSGYSDFSYAKTAIALGVENFILKPVDEDELTEAIKNACDKITREREHRYRQEIGSEYLNEQLIKGLFAGSEEIIETVAGKYEYSGYCTAVICCGGTSAERESGYRYIRRFFETVSNADIIAIDISGVLGILFKGWNREDISSAAEKIYKGYSGDIYVACGEYVDSPADICKSYATAESLFKNKFIFSHHGIVTPQTYKEAEPFDEVEYVQKIYAFIEINDTDKADMMLDSFMDSMQRRENTPEKAKINCLTMAMDIHEKIQKGAGDKLPNGLFDESFIASLSECESLYKMVDSLKKCLRDVSDRCFGKTTKSTMERVVQYIHANYNHELRLEMLAGIFGYNSAYLGKVFHQYTGENFNNYLDEIRISEAKRLLSEEDYKVYEVAEMVGYTNINYFHNKFKKYVGTSPLSFKKKYGKNE